MNTLSYALLGALASRPRTGWELAQHMKWPLALMWSARHSQIYPELNRLADADLITGEIVSGRGPRDTKKYRVTAAGRRVLADWTDSTLPEPEAPRSEIMLRVRSLWLIDPDRAIAFLTNQRRWFADLQQRRLDERRLFAAEDLGSPDHPQFYAYATLEFGLARGQAALEWFDWLLDHLQHRSALDSDPFLAPEPDPVPTD